MRISNIALWLLKGLLALLVVLFLAHAVWNIVAGRQMAAAKQRLVAAGLPMTPEQIIPPPAKDEENAAPILKRAFILMQSDWPNYSSSTNKLYLPRPDELTKMTPAQRRELGQKLKGEPYAGILKLLIEASAKPRCDFKLDYSKGFGLLLPHLSPLISATKLLAVRARLEAEAGRAEAALDGVSTGLRLAQLEREEPSLISQLVRMAGLTVALDTLQSVMHSPAATNCTGSSLQALMAEIQLIEGDRQPQFQAAMDGERVLFGSMTMEQLIAGKIKVDGILKAMELRSEPICRMPGLTYLVRPWLKWSYANYLDHLAALTPVPAEDPFSGAPYIFRNDKGGVRIYSVGPNQKDDGGVARDNEKHKADYDLGWGMTPVL